MSTAQTDKLNASTKVKRFSDLANVNDADQVDSD